MSVFSMIRRGRQAAKEQNAKKADLAKKEETRPPYKHIPKHAATDALSGGPSTWRDSDRPRILEQNRRRSAMTASGMGMSGTSTPVHGHMGMPRVNSALSHVSYPSAYASPVVQLPRAYSYSGVPPGWSHQGGEMSYSPLDMGRVPHKGKEVERVMVDSGRASRSSSKGSMSRAPLEAPVTRNSNSQKVSPVGSSSNSTSSQDDLEMKTVKHASYSPPASNPRVTTPTRPVSDSDSVHRLHPGHGRKLSDPKDARTSYFPATARYSPTRDTSISSLAAAGIPPIPAIPAMEFTDRTTSSVASSTSSTASSVTVIPVASSQSLAAKITQYPKVIMEKESHEPTDAVVETQPAPQKSRRVSKSTRFTELDTISSNISASVETNVPLPRGPQKGRPLSTVTALPTTFDQSSLPAPQQPILPPPKSGKLSKSSSPKPAKKNRWSFRSSKSTAVAV
ncbi:hypothetical protein B0T22DRAFT_135755 [Podospora appendiculata]|uniref:Uncharacterized protein n=1 Tax=Podospora appendiculata TaxID=314037 RepID=A0AAE0X7V7_9PEZI|nr:hypothetical protein B0T22DRAFT_135755 [Podospora appendiculata]